MKHRVSTKTASHFTTGGVLVANRIKFHCGIRRVELCLIKLF